MANRPTVSPGAVGGGTGADDRAGAASQAGSRSSFAGAALTVTELTATNVSPHALHRIDRPAPASGIEYRFAHDGLGQVIFRDMGGS